ncbi:MAG: hypothetical protein ACP5HZ_10220, partial [Ferrimicrobium sp.]
RAIIARSRTGQRGDPTLLASVARRLGTWRRSAVALAIRALEGRSTAMELLVHIRLAMDT